MAQCNWCKTDPIEAANRYEGPHATWCPNYRYGQRADHPAVRRAVVLAFAHGGKIAVVNREGPCTNAYLILTAEGQWRWPRGLHTGDLLDTYAELHWRDFLDQARAETAAHGQ